MSVDTGLFYFFIFEYIWQVVADLIFSNLHKSFITSSIQITFVSNASKHNTIKTSLIKQYGYENNTLYKKFLLLQYSCSVQMITCFCYLENIFQVIERRAAISIPYNDTQTNDPWKRELFVPKGNRLVQDKLYFVFVQWCVVGDVNLYQKKNWRMRKSGNKTTYTVSFANRLSRYVCAFACQFETIPWIHMFQQNKGQ